MIDYIIDDTVLKFFFLNIKTEIYDFIDIMFNYFEKHWKVDFWTWTYSVNI